MVRLIELLIEHATLSLNRPFTYCYHGNKKVDSGFRVLINFNNQELVGYVLSVKESDKSISELEDEFGFSINEIIDVIDETPLLKPDLLELADEMSEYYLASKISVLQTMLPPSLSIRHSSLKAPKIAYDQYVVVIDKSEENLTHKQIE